LLIWSESTAFFTFGEQKVDAAISQEKPQMPASRCGVEVKMLQQALSLV
jgi:hypothetical protein